MYSISDQVRPVNHPAHEKQGLILSAVWQHMLQRLFRHASLPPAPTYQPDICQLCAHSPLRVVLANCSSCTSQGLLNVRQHRMSAGHVKDSSAVVYTQTWNECKTKYDVMSNIRNLKNITNNIKMHHVWISSMFPYVTQQVTKSMAVVPQGYCLHRVRSKDSVVTAENVGKLKSETHRVDLHLNVVLSSFTCISN